MTSKTNKSSAVRTASSLRKIDLDLILRFGSEIADGLHVITGQTARREAARLRKEIAALERLARSSVPVQVDPEEQAPAMKATTSGGSRRTQGATLISRVEAEAGRVEVWREAEARFCVTVDGETVATSDSLFGVEFEALAWCHGKRCPIAAE